MSRQEENKTSNMSNYLYVATGLLGLGGAVMYLKPELKDKLKREGVKQSLLAFDSLQTTYQESRKKLRSLYTKLTGQEGTQESTKLPPLNLKSGFHEQNDDDNLLRTKLELISNGGFQHQKIIHNGNRYDLFIPNGLEFDFNQLMTSIETNQHKFDGWLSTEIDVYDPDGNLIHQGGEVSTELEKLLFKGNILPITPKYNYFWVDYFGWNHYDNIKGYNLDDIKIHWKIITEDAEEIELDSHLVIINDDHFSTVDINAC